MFYVPFWPPFKHHPQGALPFQHTATRLSLAQEEIKLEALRALEQAIKSRDIEAGLGLGVWWGLPQTNPTHAAFNLHFIRCGSNRVGGRHSVPDLIGSA